MDKEIERSFSQVLARGKYVHSIVFHKVKSEKVDEYVELVGSWYPRMAKMEENKVNLVGSWRTEVGDCETFGLSSKDLIIGNSNTNILYSPHLGIPALPRLPRITLQYSTPSRIPGVREQAQEVDHIEKHLTHAGVLILADDSSATTWRPVRATIIHASSG